LGLIGRGAGGACLISILFGLFPVVLVRDAVVRELVGPRVVFFVRDVRVELSPNQLCFLRAYLRLRDGFVSPIRALT